MCVCFGGRFKAHVVVSVDAGVVTIFYCLFCFFFLFLSPIVVFSLPPPFFVVATFHHSKS